MATMQVDFLLFSEMFLFGQCHFVSFFFSSIKIQRKTHTHWPASRPEMSSPSHGNGSCLLQQTRVCSRKIWIKKVIFTGWMLNTSQQMEMVTPKVHLTVANLNFLGCNKFRHAKKKRM